MENTPLLMKMAYLLHTQANIYVKYWMCYGLGLGIMLFTICYKYTYVTHPQNWTLTG
jgi:hypothetical protein